MRRLRVFLFLCLASLLVPFVSHAQPLPPTYYFQITGDGLPGAVTFQINSSAISEGSGSFGDATYDDSWAINLSIDGNDLGSTDFALGTYQGTPFLIASEGFIAFFSDLTNVGYIYRAGGSYTAFDLGNYALTDGENNATLKIADTPFAAATPEPSSFVLLGTGVVGAAGAFRRRFIVRS